ncbi:hypothetical protein ESY86_16725 [Subsaximicrobium wynnwilliamsii]|uniref:Uncharacterized protein n=1 Tax=Subsaximicrobium wynnwilliamsii TaxID=291179 RepID=A0A5C6ZD18_9FLAO|nr:hypothetical protein [Subsaximicrobium wynnwilliamsii]TXD81868.1 hypothetical protein ESY87_16625 [Subsaximicrobium wynnwilliamsii]TXD87537.1 hypothetical protein ESY86_16725 [Subsaximicrobium wynnwilliamsii]TXE01220.1 hypothetical protein ESY88_16975 [Subsaximicrobium wynnwilliamsii]
MENKEQIKNSENRLAKIQGNIDNTLEKSKEVVNIAKEGTQMVSEVTNNIQDTFNKANNLFQGVKGLKDSFMESQKLQAQTEIELLKIRSEHQQMNRIITEEYGKQKQSMDKASDVVDAGLESNDINKIREGLTAMTNVANHNPMENHKKALDNELERNLNQDFDDDFTLEF